MSNHLCPRRHAVDGCEESAHQHKNHDEEERDGHRLLLRVGVGGDEQSEAEERDEVDGEKAVEQRYASERDDAVEQPRDAEQADGEHEHADQPERYELADDEMKLADGCNVDLFDGADSFSRTMLSDDMNPATMVTRTARMPGTMNIL